MRKLWQSSFCSIQEVSAAKHYYQKCVCKHLPHLFPRRVSYNRFIELEKEVLLPLTIFIKQVLLSECTGISFVDSTPLRVCRYQRILIHKTFEGLAERGKCSIGWFLGLKQHLIINDKGKMLNFTLMIPTIGNSNTPVIITNKDTHPYRILK
jgi:hypothetical protein